MKKLLYLFILLFILFLSCPVKTSAQTIISDSQYIEVNIGNNEMLKEDGLTLISGDVNFNKCGTYQVTYSNKDGTIYKKDVHIIEKNKEFISKNYNQIEIPSNPNYIIREIIPINDNDYYIISNYQTINPTYYDEEHLCVSFYENNTYKWEYQYYKFSRFSSYVLYNKNLIITGLVYNENNDYINTICLFEITPNREIKKLREISTNESCICYGVNIIDNEVYLVTTTTGTTNDYNNINMDGGMHIIILKLAYYNFNITKGYVLKDVPDFNRIEAKFYQNKIALNINFVKKVVEDDYEYYHGIYVVDTNFTSITKKLFNTGLDSYLDFGVGDNIIYLIGKSNSLNPDTIYVRFLNDNTVNRMVYLSKKEDLTINNASVIDVIGDEIYLSISHFDYTMPSFLGYCKVDPNNPITYYFKKEVNKYPYKTKLYGDNIYETFYQGDKLYLDKIDLIEIREEKIDSTYLKKSEKTIYHNLKRLVNLNKNESFDTFGTYNYISYFIDSNNTKYYLKGMCDVLLKTNVLENEVYQTHKQVFINGKGMLNGNEFISGESIDNIGKYLLVITGANGQTVAVNFEIKDLNVSLTDKEKTNLLVSDEKIYLEQVKDESFVTINYDIINPTTSNDVIGICISIVLLFSLSFIFLRKKI